MTCRRFASAAVITIVVLAAAGCDRPSGPPPHPLHGLALVESDLPTGITAFRSNESQYGTTVTGGTEEPCHTASRNRERSRDGAAVASSSAMKQHIWIRAEVINVRLAMQNTNVELACDGKAALAPTPEDMLANPPSVLEYRTGNGRLAAMHGFVDIDGRSVDVFLMNRALWADEADAPADTVDPGDFWKVFRAQIAKVEAAA